MVWALIKTEILNWSDVDFLLYTHSAVLVLQKNVIEIPNFFSKFMEMFQISVFEETVNKKNLSIIFYSLRSKRFRASSSITLEREQTKKRITGEGVGCSRSTFRAITRLEKLATQANFLRLKTFVKIVTVTVRMFVEVLKSIPQ